MNKKILKAIKNKIQESFPAMPIYIIDDKMTHEEACVKLLDVLELLCFRDDYTGQEYEKLVDKAVLTLHRIYNDYFLNNAVSE